MLDTFSLYIGKAFLIIGGTFLVIFLLGVIVYIVCFTWHHASNYFRDVCKAESFIHEYRRNREKFLEWLAKGDEK